MRKNRPACIMGTRTITRGGTTMTGWVLIMFISLNPLNPQVNAIATATFATAEACIHVGRTLFAGQNRGVLASCFSQHDGSQAWLPPGETQPQIRLPSAR
jgi:hypothetical protein